VKRKWQYNSQTKTNILNGLNQLDMSLINTSRRKESRLPNTFVRFALQLPVMVLGQPVSLIGTWMQTMAQQVLVYELPIRRRHWALSI
jgi:hypothetical protein